MLRVLTGVLVDNFLTEPLKLLLIASVMVRVLNNPSAKNEEVEREDKGPNVEMVSGGEKELKELEIVEIKNKNVLGKQGKRSKVAWADEKGENIVAGRKHTGKPIGGRRSGNGKSRSPTKTPPKDELNGGLRTSRRSVASKGNGGRASEVTPMNSPR